MKNIAFILLSFLLFSVGDTFAQMDFSEVDEHARKLRKSATFQQTAERLTSPFDTEAEKARAIFIWLTDNINYDIKKLIKQQQGPGRQRIEVDAKLDLEEVRRQRKLDMAKKAFKLEKGVCEDYSYLFQFMCESVGLEAEFIPGYGRNDYQDINREHKRSNHAWNAIKIDGNWYLLDATWAAGNTDTNAGRFTRDFKEGFFMTNPERFILTHFPDDHEWQLLENPVSKEDFSVLPYVYHRFLLPEITDYFPKSGIIKKNGKEIKIGLEVADHTKRYVLIKNRKMTKYSPITEGASITFTIPSSRLSRGELTIAVIDGKKAKPVISYRVI